MLLLRRRPRQPHGLIEEVETARADAEPLALTGAYPCYNVYATRDGGRVAVSCLEPAYWKRFCEAAGRRDLVSIQYDRDAESRRRVAAVVAERTRQE